MPFQRASQVVLVVKNPPADAGDTKDAGSIPGSGRSLKEGPATHSGNLAWEIPWTEEPGVTQRQTRLKRLGMHACHVSSFLSIWCQEACPRWSPSWVAGRCVFCSPCLVGIFLSPQSPPHATLASLIYAPLGGVGL